MSTGAQNVTFAAAEGDDHGACEAGHCFDFKFIGIVRSIDIVGGVNDVFWGSNIVSGCGEVGGGVFIGETPKPAVVRNAGFIVTTSVSIFIWIALYSSGAVSTSRVSNVWVRETVIVFVKSMFTFAECSILAACTVALSFAGVLSFGEGRRWGAKN